MNLNKEALSVSVPLPSSKACSAVHTTTVPSSAPAKSRLQRRSTHQGLTMYASASAQQQPLQSSAALRSRCLAFQPSARNTCNTCPIARSATCSAFIRNLNRSQTLISRATHSTGNCSRSLLHKQQSHGRQQQGQCKRRIACRVLTESKEMTVGSQAPSFELPEPLTGKTVKLTELAAGAKATLVMFICNHCPFVVMLKPAITALAKEYQAKGVAVVAISSNSIQTHPQDGPEKMAQDAKTHGYTFPYLYDETQTVARAYGAACTPEFYVFDQEMKLTYHGQFDDARPNNGKEITGADLRVALDAAIAGQGLPTGFKPRPSIGCNIKWHPGQEPDYYGSQIVKK